MTRALDILLAGSALIVLSPLLLVIIVILRLTGEREVFYRQERVGKDGKTFDLLKFATMLKASPSLGAGLITLRNDPRVLPFGRFLRKTKLNELPQLVNVLKGDMSIIGPRPQVPKQFSKFPPHVQTELKRVRPGLSGIGSIVFRDEEALLSQPGIDPEALYAEVIAPYKGELELWFIRRQSIALTLALIFLTVWVVLVPGSTAYRRWFSDLPSPPEGLRY